MSPTVFLGPPGAGKSTLIKAVAPVLDATVFHAARWARERGLPYDSSARARGELLPLDSEAFLADVLARERAIIDGFPRSAEQAEALMRFAPDATVIVVNVPEHVSLVRQIARDGEDTARQRGKLARYWTHDRAAIDAIYRARMHGSSLSYHVLDGARAPDALVREARRIVGRDLDALDWDFDALAALEATGIDHWVTGGSIFAAFWGGRFGPRQSGRDVDVSVLTDADAARMRAALPPIRRWAVTSMESLARVSGRVWDCGADHRALRIERLTDRSRCLRANARLALGHVQLLCPDPRDEFLLWEGRVDHDGSDVARVAALAQKFPGIAGRTVLSDWASIDEVVRAGEHGGKRSGWPLCDDEEAPAARIRGYYARADRSASAPPVPPIEANDDRSKVVTSTSLDVALAYASDADWAAWILSQLVSRNPRKVRDPWISAVFAAQEGVEQKPTHQGWELARHAAYCAAMLRCGDLTIGDRTALRRAALLHDIGKVASAWTPGAHGLIGAKMARKFTDDSRVLDLVRLHDAPGHTLRWLTEPKYAGPSPTETGMAIANSTVTLGLVMRLWEADVASVAALRWILPIVPDAADLIRQSYSVTRRIFGLGAS